MNPYFCKTNLILWGKSQPLWLPYPTYREGGNRGYLYSVTLLKTGLQYSKCPFSVLRGISLFSWYFPFYSQNNGHFTFYSHLWFYLTFYSQFLAFFHFTASEICCFHFTGLMIFPVLQPRFERFTLYIFKKKPCLQLYILPIAPLYRCNQLCNTCNSTLQIKER